MAFGTGFGSFASSIATNTYVANAVDYNGTTNYLARGADFTGSTDSSTGILSAWVRIDGGDTNVRYLISDPALACIVSLNSNNKFLITLSNAGATRNLTFGSNTAYTSGSTWLNILASWDANFSAGNKLTHFYVNNVSDKLVSGDGSAAFNCDYTQSNHYVGCDDSGSQNWDGCVSEVYWAPGQFLDFSNSANRAKFILAGKPVSLGTDGSTPTGTAPIFYSKGNAASIATNSGTGGNMSSNGVFNNCSTHP